MQALAAALKSGAAPELIFLDLRNNPFGDEANELLASFRRGFLENLCFHELAGSSCSRVHHNIVACNNDRRRFNRKGTS